MLNHLLRFGIGGAIVNLFAILGYGEAGVSGRHLCGCTDDSTGNPLLDDAQAGSRIRFARRKIDGCRIYRILCLRLRHQFRPDALATEGADGRKRSATRLVRNSRRTLGTLVAGLAMRIRLTFASLKETSPREYLTRFLFGGAVTVLAGLIADRYGPVFGGLFLAFPGIFPAGVSLVQKHKESREKEAGKVGTQAAAGEASAEATGASDGTLGLIAFAVVL